MQGDQDPDEEFVGVVLMRWVALSALCWWLGLKAVQLLLRLIWPAT